MFDQVAEGNMLQPSALPFSMLSAKSTTGMWNGRSYTQC